MQITNSVVCDTGKGCIYKQIKPPLVGEHAFPLMGFVCIEAHVTQGIAYLPFYRRSAQSNQEVFLLSDYGVKLCTR